MDIDTLMMATCAVLGIVCLVGNLFVRDRVYLTYQEQVIPQKKKGEKK